jgi:hypothetical protein
VVNSVNWDPEVQVGSRVRVGFGTADVSLFPRAEEAEIVQYSSQAV